MQIEKQMQGQFAWLERRMRKMAVRVTGSRESEVWL